jgi:hypothetical protein
MIWVSYIFGILKDVPKPTSNDPKCMGLILDKLWYVKA